MTQRQQEMAELTRIIDLKQRLELLQQWVAMGIKRTRTRRMDAWGTIEREASAMRLTLSEGVPDVKPSILPSMSEQRAMGVEPSGDSL